MENAEKRERLYSLVLLITLLLSGGNKGPYISIFHQAPQIMESALSVLLEFEYTCATLVH